MKEEIDATTRDLANAAPALHFVREAHPHILMMFAAWLDARRGAPVPLRKDLRPESIASILPYVWMYKYDTRLDDFVCRISGERINNAWGRSLRGTRFRDVVGAEAHAAAMRRWKVVLATPCLQYGRIVDPADGAVRIVAERLVLPLADADGVVCYTIGLSVYPYRQDDRDRTPPVWDDVMIVPCADLVRIGLPESDGKG